MCAQERARIVGGPRGPWGEAISEFQHVLFLSPPTMRLFSRYPSGETPEGQKEPASTGIPRVSNPPLQRRTTKSKLVHSLGCLERRKRNRRNSSKARPPENQFSLRNIPSAKHSKQHLTYPSSPWPPQAPKLLNEDPKTPRLSAATPSVFQVFPIAQGTPLHQRAKKAAVRQGFFRKEREGHPS